MKKEIGYYKVNDKIFGNKFDAVMYAQQTGATVSWWFFDEQLNSLDWKKEPDLSLDELYKLRAQQIRNQYDYIVVFCSGGADSTNVIKTFINNNIRVDEIIALAPMSGLQNYNFNRTDVSENNTISETKFALFPLLNDIASSNPNIKITINDFFEEMTSYKEEDWLFNSCGNIVTVLTSHFTDVYKFKHIDELIQKGKRIGLVYGTDKPLVRIGPEGQLSFVLIDAGVNYLNMPAERELPSVDRVLFYWTPDLPEIMIKQSHVVAKAMRLPENYQLHEGMKTSVPYYGNSSFKDRIDYRIKNNIDPIDTDLMLEKYLSNEHYDAKSTLLSHKTIYQRKIVPFIYPSTYSNDLFQCQKVNSDFGFFTKDQAWVHELHKSTRISDMVKSGVRTLYNSINPMYLNIDGTGFLNCVKTFEFGNLNEHKY